ncbi:DUF4134 domain-containing protein [Nibrella saemangeumensis]|uniref:DUF4134 domain-containing protein n=2 Tax=Nibrella TaxID=1649473 RepID=A0ABP8KXK0_9BACT
MKKRIVQVAGGAILLSYLVLANASECLAQTGSGAAKKGLDEATKEITGAWETVGNLMYAICAIVGVVGGIQVYSKWSNGDPDTRKAAASWFGALIFAGLVLLVIKAVFNP